jgi:hypothetical protein
MIGYKKIAIITTNSFGYIDFVAERLKRNENVDLLYINIDKIPFSYKNGFSRAINFFLKLFIGYGLKEKNKTNFIKEAIVEKKQFDQILVIRPDKLQKEALICLRENSIEMTCYLFDGIENFKAQKDVMCFFDTIYSYDRNDVEKYKFKFLTNFIFDDEIKDSELTQKVFNISSFDKRFCLLEKLADYLKKNEISFRFIVKKNKKDKHCNIEIIDKYLCLQEVKKIIAQSKVLIDIQKKNQSGLSFRVFESLGYNKKLITNNPDIVNYDFYNKNNIYIISENDWTVPKEFFETEYSKIDSEILDQYKLENWNYKVFKVK